MHTQHKTVAMPTTSPAIPMAGTITETTMATMHISESIINATWEQIESKAQLCMQRQNRTQSCICIHTAHNKQLQKNTYIYVATLLTTRSPIHMQRNPIHRDCTLASNTHSHTHTHAHTHTHTRTHTHTHTHMHACCIFV